MDSTYRPQSPDLSSFGTSAPNRPGQNLHPSTSNYAPRSPNLNSFVDADPSVSPPKHQLPPQLAARNSALGAYHPPRSQPSFDTYNDNFNGHHQHLSIPGLPPSHNFAQPPPQENHQFFTPLQAQQSFQNFKTEPDYSHSAHFPLYSGIPSPVKGQNSLQHDMAARMKKERGFKVEDGADTKALGPSLGIDVKTKFPVARIKRIMQADEEVGKVAQVTPVAVSKALELFMISLVTKSADLARNGNSKRVTAQHLKKAIEADEQFDFLGEIVSKVIEGPEAGGKKVKDDDDSDDEMDAKTAKKSRGRKKKD